MFVTLACLRNNENISGARAFVSPSARFSFPTRDGHVPHQKNTLINEVLDKKIVFDTNVPGAGESVVLLSRYNITSYRQPRDRPYKNRLIAGGSIARSGHFERVMHLEDPFTILPAEEGWNGGSLWEKS